MLLVPKGGGIYNREFRQCKLYAAYKNEWTQLGIINPQKYNLSLYIYHRQYVSVYTYNFTDNR